MFSLQSFLKLSNKSWLLLFLSVTIASTLSTAGQGIYEEPNAFVSRQFGGDPPPASILYPDAALKKKIKSVLGYRYSKFRIRYWLKGDRSVWILQEIGKEKFITAGFTVEALSIKDFKVLIFRESRGWEVRYDSFSRQFSNARLTAKLKLDRNIDNISGATLSVRAVTKLARLALLFHQAVQQQ